MSYLSLFLALLVCTVSLEGQSNKKKRGSLYGTVVVIDPGHGGSDPGSNRCLNGKRSCPENQLVVEDEYVYDVALRVRRLIRERDGLTYLTVHGDTRERNGSPREIFPHERNERFALDNSLVHASQSGLSARVAYGNRQLARHRNHKRVWVSIHFDVVGEDVDGVRIIYGGNSLPLAQALERSFARAGRMREHGPIAENGDDRYGIRDLYVLRSVNRSPQKVLIELGNFLNPHDLWRIRDPRVREAYALAIVNALENQ